MKPDVKVVKKTSDLPARTARWTGNRRLPQTMAASLNVSSKRSFLMLDKKLSWRGGRAGSQANSLLRFVPNVVLLNKTYPTDIETIIKFKKPYKT